MDNEKPNIDKIKEDEEKYNLIIRTLDSDNLPDVEMYVRTLHKKGFFKDLIKKNQFTVEEIKKLPFAKMCKIFFRLQKDDLENGDIRIFKDTGDYQIVLTGKT